MNPTYTTIAGDTLSQIAQNHGVGVSDILKVNPNITNPNLIGVGQAIVLPIGTKTAAPVVDVGGTGGAPAAVVAQPVAQPVDVNTILAGLGLNLPKIDDGTQSGKLSKATSDAKAALDDFSTKLKGDLTHTSNNPFLLSNEILGEQKRVIADNQDTLKTLTDNYNNSVKAEEAFQTANNTSITQRTSIATLAATEIQRQYDNSQKTKQDKIAMEEKIQELRNNTPKGQTFTINGQTYAGLKKDTPTQGQIDTATESKAFALAGPELEKSKNGGQFVDGNVFLRLRTDFAKIGGKVSAFDDAFAALLSPEDRAKYGVGKVTGTDPTPDQKVDPYTSAKKYIQARKDVGVSKKDLKNALDNDANVSAVDKLLYDRAIEELYGK